MRGTANSPWNFLGVFVVLVLVVLAFFYRNEIFAFTGLIRSFDYEELQVLELENKALRSELNELREENNIVPDSFVRAKIYSRYPFNDRRLIVINLGEADGLRVGMPVLVSGPEEAPSGAGVLLGRIKNVFRRQAEVETVFDPAWRSSVIVGPENVKALVEGGVTPLLTLIAKDSVIVSGDVVSNTSPEFPFGLVLGEAGKTRPSSDDVWLTVELESLYNPEKLTEVLVVVNFP